jgi:hypothetical protein
VLFLVQRKQQARGHSSESAACAPVHKKPSEIHYHLKQYWDFLIIGGEEKFFGDSV